MDFSLLNWIIVHNWTKMESVSGKESPLVQGHKVFWKWLSEPGKSLRWHELLRQNVCRNSGCCWEGCWGFEHGSAVVKSLRGQKANGKVCRWQGSRTWLVWNHTVSVIRMHCGLAKSVWQRAKGYRIVHRKQRMSLAFLFLKDFIYLFLERGEGRKRNSSPAKDLACNPGMYGDQESNW